MIGEKWATYEGWLLFLTMKYFVEADIFFVNDTREIMRGLSIYMSFTNDDSGKFAKII